MNKVMSKSNLAILVLIFTASIIGFLIYKKTFTNPTSSKPQESSRQSRQPSGYTSRRPTPAGLTDEEKKIMDPPRQASSQKEKTAYFDLASKLAVDTDTLNLNNCEKPDPLVIKLDVNQTFNIINSDSKGHTIILNPDSKIDIKAGETKKVKADFGKGQGYFGYLCDNVGGLVGVFLLEGKPRQ